MITSAGSGNATELVGIAGTFFQDEILAGFDNHSYEEFLEDFDLWNIYLKPSGKEWFLIFLYLVVFTVSLIGNGLSKYNCSIRLLTM